MSNLTQEFEPPTLCMNTKELTLKNFIDKAYNNFKDNGKFDDLNNEELTTFFLLESKNLLTEILYANRKGNLYIQNDKIKRLFKNIGILTKINDIDLKE